ncbi:sensor histidine kinase [Ammoniphilus sp. 3BR4]|uniref:sensor histidine kinase n=1 Tax=Ammoniphilus sp. 3BR4 TaxID=3158265 RepID=UPI003466608C
MRQQYLSTFHKINILLIILLVSILTVYTYSINRSLNTVQSTIQTNNQNKNRFLVSQLDRNVEQLAMLGIALGQEKMVSQFNHIDTLDTYNKIKLQSDVSDMLDFLSLSYGWPNQLSIYSILLHRWINTGSSNNIEPFKLDATSKKWKLDHDQFVRYTLHPFSEPQSSRFITKVSFPVTNITKMLDGAKVGGNNDPFFYAPFSGSLLFNTSSNQEVSYLIVDALSGKQLGMDGTEIIEISKIKYLINYAKSSSLDWYLIDYIPLDQAFLPIEKTKHWFYISSAVLIISGFIASFFLYRNIQQPIMKLINAVKRIKHGDYSVRISDKSHNEFEFLNLHFNEMAAHIEELIENVYKERIISREAQLKELQAQINPHFLYNCLFFINNMVRLGNDDAINAMTKNLAEYFRYTTRTEKLTSTMEAEIKVIENYLNIYKLRMPRLNFKIEILESMKMLPIPKLLLQPIVENSVVHGIEPMDTEGNINIWSTEDETHYYIYVQDNGQGLSPLEIQELKQKLMKPLDESMGCALWNIQHRMTIHFGESARLDFKPTVNGGLTTIITWPKLEDEYYVPASHRR